MLDLKSEFLSQLSPGNAYIDYAEWLANELTQTKKELGELQDYLCDYFGMEAWKAPKSLLAKHIEASKNRNKPHG